MHDIVLTKPYISVEQADGTRTYGGNQAWLSTEVERSFGCGLIAAADILRYLRGCDPEEMQVDADAPALSGLEELAGFVISRRDYLDDIRRLAADFRIRGKLGITGFGLARRMNRIFRREGMPYRAKWSIGRKRLQRRLPEMLEADIPVLLSVGPGFFHKKDHLPLYRRTETGVYEKTSSMRDHYVTVTGLLRAGDNADGSRSRAVGVGADTGTMETVTTGTAAAEPVEMLRISSWGYEYYVNYIEYLDHVKKNDNFLFSNILYIREKAV